MQIAEESTHWYCGEDCELGLCGAPCYTIKKKDGSGFRNTTIRDARIWGLVPSVTTVMSLANKPALNIWIARQTMLASMTLPRKPGETDPEFCDRVILDSKEQTKAAAERGTKLHTAIERAIAGNADPEYEQHIKAVKDALGLVGVDLFGGTSERSFAHALKFGGKVDYSCDTAVVDFKSKDIIKDGKEMAFDEHICQLSAYRFGLGYSESTRLLSVFVGVDDAKVVIREWTNDEARRGMEMFVALLAFWKAKSGII